MYKLFTISIILLVSCTATQQASITEKDPVFKASLAATITTDSFKNWRAEPLFSSSVAYQIKKSDIEYWDNTGDTVRLSFYRKNETYSAPQIDAKIAAVQNGGNCNCYDKPTSDGKYEWQVNLQKDTRRFFSAVGSIKYDSLTGQISYTQPTNVSAFNNDKKYGVAIQDISITGTTTKTFQITYADGSKSSPITFTDLQGSGGGEVTTQQLTDSVNKLNNKIQLQNSDIDLLKKQVDSLRKAVYDVNSFYYKQTNWGVMLMDNTLTVADKVNIVKDSLQATAIRTTIVLTQWTGTDGMIEAVKKKADSRFSSMLIGSRKFLITKLIQGSS